MNKISDRKLSSCRLGQSAVCVVKLALRISARLHLESQVEKVQKDRQGQLQGGAKATKNGKLCALFKDVLGHTVLEVVRTQPVSQRETKCTIPAI